MGKKVKEKPSSVDVAPAAEGPERGPTTAAPSEAPKATTEGTGAAPTSGDGDPPTSTSSGAKTQRKTTRSRRQRSAASKRSSSSKKKTTARGRRQRSSDAGADDESTTKEGKKKPRSRPKRASKARTGKTERSPGRKKTSRSRKTKPLDPAAQAAELREQIAALQQRLAELTGQPLAEAHPQGYSSPQPAPTAAEPSPVAHDVEKNAEQTPTSPTAGDPSPSDSTRELLTSEYFLRQWGRLGLRRRTEELDEFGLDSKYESRARGVLDFLSGSYFRTEVEGVHHVPSSGRCLIVANHSGGPIPYDGLLLRTALRRAHPHKRQLRWLTEDFFHHLPFVGVFMTRLGAVRACQENAQRLLHAGNVLAVFPEGVKGIGKLYRNRYRLQRFGRGGFIRLCIRTGTPLVPCAIIGAEDANPMLYRLEYMTRSLRVPYLPITPTFPLLGPLGLLPAPAKIRIRFTEPISFDGYSPKAADDGILVGRLSDRVRATIQSSLDDGLAKRHSVFFG